MFRAPWDTHGSTPPIIRRRDLPPKEPGSHSIVAVKMYHTTIYNPVGGILRAAKAIRFRPAWFSLLQVSYDEPGTYRTGTTVGGSFVVAPVLR